MVASSRCRHSNAILATAATPGNMPKITDILDQNNNGVQYICSGRYKEAKKSFKAALLLLTIFQQHQQDNDASTMITSSYMPISFVPKSIPESDSSNGSDDKLYMYRNVLLAYYQNNDDNTSKNKKNDFILDAKTSAYLTATVTFNLSITFHINLLNTKQQQQGRRASSSSKSKKTKKPMTHKDVLVYYRTPWAALRVFDSHKEEEDSQQNYSFRNVIALGVLNNMGALLYEQSKYAKACNCFETIKVLLTEQQSHKQDAYCLETSVRSQLLMNVFIAEERMESSQKQKSRTNAIHSSLHCTTSISKEDHPVERRRNSIAGTLPMNTMTPTDASPSTMNAWESTSWMKLATQNRRNSTSMVDTTNSSSRCSSAIRGSRYYDLWSETTAAVAAPTSFAQRDSLAVVGLL